MDYGEGPMVRDWVTYRLAESSDFLASSLAAAVIVPAYEDSSGSLLITDNGDVIRIVFSPVS